MAEPRLRFFAVTTIANAVAAGTDHGPKLTQAERDVLVEQQLQADEKAHREARAAAKAGQR